MAVNSRLPTTIPAGMRRCSKPNTWVNDGTRLNRPSRNQIKNDMATPAEARPNILFRLNQNDRGCFIFFYVVFYKTANNGVRGVKKK